MCLFSMIYLKVPRVSHLPLPILSRLTCMQSNEPVEYNLRQGHEPWSRGTSPCLVVTCHSQNRYGVYEGRSIKLLVSRSI